MTVGVRVEDYIATITTGFVTLKYQSNLFLFFGLLLQLCFCEEAQDWLTGVLGSVPSYATDSLGDLG